MILGTADRQGSLLGVDSLLSKLFEGDDDSFYAQLAKHGDELVRDEDCRQQVVGPCGPLTVCE
jgi:hypothetical protein